MAGVIKNQLRHIGHLGGEHENAAYCSDIAGLPCIGRLREMHRLETRFANSCGNFFGNPCGKFSAHEAQSGPIR